MYCYICFETFFTPKTQEELKKIYKQNIKNYEDYLKFTNFLIIPNYNESHKCYIENCDSLICRDCWNKINHKGKSFLYTNVNDRQTIYEYVMCPYCRNIDWKYYMNNVFNELNKKIKNIKY